MKDLASQPISCVEWVRSDSVQPNDYNPNRQAPPEHRLLETSILQDGWTQPIVVFDNGLEKHLIIVDGEHRWKTSKKPSIAKITGGMIPIVRIKKSEQERMMSTIRHNRARGEHAVINMSDIVKKLFASGLSEDELCVLLGMEDEEVRRLKESAGLPTVVTRKHKDYNKGWVPDANA